MLEIVLSCLYNAEVSIYELALLPLDPSLLDNGMSLRRIKYLHACVEATKQALEHFLTFEAAQYPAIPCCVMFQFTRSIQVLYLLSIHEEPGWDRSAVRSCADVLDYISRIAAKLTEAHELYQTENTTTEYQNFKKTAGLLIKTSETWRQVLERTSETPAMASPSMNIGDGIDPTLIDLMNDYWAMGGIESYEG